MQNYSISHQTPVFGNKNKFVTQAGIDVMRIPKNSKVIFVMLAAILDSEETAKITACQQTFSFSAVSIYPENVYWQNVT